MSTNAKKQTDRRQNVFLLKTLCQPKKKKKNSHKTEENLNTNVMYRIYFNSFISDPHSYSILSMYVRVQTFCALNFFIILI